MTSKKKKEFSDRFRDLLPNIEDITEEIIAANLDHTKALAITSQVDDLVDWAPNAIAWCTDKRFLGMTPFAKQAEILLHLFEEYCVKCSDLEYLNDIPVKAPIEEIMAKIALLEFGKCPHCGFTKADGRASGHFKDPVELVAAVGQRSGKSAVCAQAVSYLLHRSLMLTSPWRSYGLTPGQLLEFTFVATTMGQSEKTLWATFKGMFTGSAWFKAYKEICDAEGKKNGVLVTVKDLATYIHFTHKNILVRFAANDPSSLRGATRIGGAIDELSWFGNTEGGKRANGPETYVALNNSCLTLRTEVSLQIKADPNCNLPMAMMFNVSSPVALDDPLMVLYRDSADNPKTVRKHWATWEAHPKNTWDLLDELGETKKSSFDRDYGAQPPLAHDPLFRRTSALVDAFNHPLAKDPLYGPIIRPTTVGFIDTIDVTIGSRIGQALVAELAEPPELNLEPLKNLNEDSLEKLGAGRELFEELVSKPATERMHVMGVDLGHSNNGLGVCCGYLTDKGKLITDFALAIQPTETLTIDIVKVFNLLIKPLVDHLNVVAVFYDRWSSLFQLQELSAEYGSMGPLNDAASRRSWLRKLAKRKERPAFMADRYSLNMADAQMLVARLEQGDCLFPAMEIPFMELVVNKNIDPTDYPYAYLAVQAATVRARSNRLLKPNDGDDDLFRAWANMAVPALSNELVMDLLRQEYRGQKQVSTSGAGFHVSFGQQGRGIRSVADIGHRTTSNRAGTNDFPVVVRKGKYRG